MENIYRKIDSRIFERIRYFLQYDIPIIFINICYFDEVYLQYKCQLFAADGLHTLLPLPLKACTGADLAEIDEAEFLQRGHALLHVGDAAFVHSISSTKQSPPTRTRAAKRFTSRTACSVCALSQ